MLGCCVLCMQRVACCGAWPAAGLTPVSDWPAKQIKTTQVQHKSFLEIVSNTLWALLVAPARARSWAGLPTAPWALLLPLGCWWPSAASCWRSWPEATCPTRARLSVPAARRRQELRPAGQRPPCVTPTGTGPHVPCCSWPCLQSFAWDAGAARGCWCRPRPQRRPGGCRPGLRRGRPVRVRPGRNLLLNLRANRPKPTRESKIQQQKQIQAHGLNWIRSPEGSKRRGPPFP